jgi:AraC-like DNA-binding protein
LWYQINGQGILQNVTRNTFGAARPGLLGAMEQCERHTYLHQRDTFECFIMEFSLLPSKTAKCYWNSAIEGKKILDKEQQRDFENILIDMFNGMTGGRNRWGAATCARLLDMITVLLENGLLVIEESQFPKNKAGSLVAKARQFMKLHYHRRRHQSALEKECGVDINYLNIIFKKETGRTLYQYLTDIRLEQAKHLLEDTGQSVSDIGARVGYPNNNSFTRAFGKYAGATPSAYRAAHGRGAAEGPAGNSPVTTPP